MNPSKENKKDLVNQLYMELGKTMASLVVYRREFVSRLNRVSVYICIYLFFTIFLSVSHLLDKVIFLIFSLLYFLILTSLIQVLLFPQLKKYQQESEKGDNIFAKLSDLLDWGGYRKSQLYNNVDLKYSKLLFNYYSETRGRKTLAGKKNHFFSLLLVVLNIVVLMIFIVSVYSFLNWGNALI